MNESFCPKKTSWTKKIIVGGMLLAFFFNSLTPAGAQMLPVPGSLVGLTPGFKPPVLLGMKVHPENPLLFDFIVDQGQTQLSPDGLKSETAKLVKYFLAALTIPDKQIWVNLSPYEKDRIIPGALEETELGRDMLTQDYMLKQITASLLYPENEIGKQFWKRIYEEAAKKLGTTDISVNTFNKVWIVPDLARIYTNSKSKDEEKSCFILKSHLKVMLEEDYLAREHNTDTPQAQSVLNEETKSMLRKIILPEIEHEINEGKNFANLRQIYHSMILAAWFKKTLKESLLGHVYIDQNKVLGIDLADKKIREEIYNQYIAAFKKGVFNYIKEDYDAATQQNIPRKYFSGGLIGVDPNILSEGSFGDLEALVHDKSSSSLTELATKFKMLAVNLGILNRTDKENVGEETARGLQGNGDQSLQQMAANILAGDSMLLVAKNYSTSMPPADVVNSGINNLTDRLSRYISTRAGRSQLRKTYGQEFLLYLQEKKKRYSNILGRVIAGDAVAINAADFRLGFYSHEPGVRQALLRQMNEQDFEKTFSSGTFVLSYEAININKEKESILEEYLFYALLASRSMSYSYEFARQLFPESYSPSENAEEVSQLKTEMEALRQTLIQQQSHFAVFDHFPFAEIDPQQLDRIDQKTLRQRIERSEDTAFEESVQLFVTQRFSSIDVLVRAIQRADKNHTKKMEIISKYAGNLISLALSKSNFPRKSNFSSGALAILQAAAQSGNTQALDFFVLYHIKFGEASYINQCFFRDEERVLNAFVAHRTELLDGVLHDVQRSRARAVDALERLARKKLALDILGPAALATNDSKLNRLFADLLENGVLALEFFSEHLSDIVGLAKNNQDRDRAEQMMIWIKSAANNKNAGPAQRTAIEALGEIALTVDNDTVARDFERFLTSHDPTAVLFFTEHTDDIVRLAKDTTNFNRSFRMVSWVESMLENHEESAVRAAVQIGRSGLLDNLTHRVITDDFQIIGALRGQVNAITAIANQNKLDFWTRASVFQLLVALAANNISEANEYIIKAIEENKTFGPIEALAHAPIEKQDFTTRTIHYLDDLLQRDAIDIPTEKSGLRMKGMRFAYAIWVLGLYANQGVLSAQQIIERHIPDMEYLIVQPDFSHFDLANIFTALGNIAVQSAEAKEMIDAYYARRGAQDVLPPNRQGLTKVAVIIIDNFNEDGKESHGLKVEDSLKEAMGRQAEIPIFRISSKGDERNIRIQEELQTLVSNHPDTVFIVNLSLKSQSNTSAEKINGILNFEMVRELGTRGVVFTIAASNEAGANYFTFPDLDNIVVVGAVVRSEKGWQKAPYSNLGPDVTLSAAGTTGDSQGTSFSAPRINGLLARILNDEPELSIPAAIQRLKDFAKPIDDPAFALGYLGAGAVDVEEILAQKNDRPRPASAEIRRLIQNPDDLVKALRTNIITTQDILDLPSSSPYSLNNPIYIIAKHNIKDPIITPIIIAGLKSENEDIRHACINHVWVYAEPEAIPLLVQIAKTERYFNYNPATKIVDQEISNPALIPVLTAGLTSSAQDTIVKKALWAYTDPDFKAELTKIAGQNTYTYSNPVYIISRNKDTLNLQELAPVLAAGELNLNSNVQALAAALMPPDAQHPSPNNTKGGIDFDLASIDLQEEGPQENIFLSSGAVNIPNFTGLMIKNIIIKDAALSDFDKVFLAP